MLYHEDVITAKRNALPDVDRNKKEIRTYKADQLL